MIERGVAIVAAFICVALLSCQSSMIDQSQAATAAEHWANAIPLTVRTPHSGFNRLVVSVTVCEPGTARCATIDDVMVDTGSTGLRLEASAVPRWLRLPAHVGPDQRPLAECLHFLHDDAWGPLVQADLHMGGMSIGDLPLQIIADDGGPQPDACPRSSVRPTSNGTLGVGPHLSDCPGSCDGGSKSPGYFVEEAGTWQAVRGPIDPADRLPNPVSRLPEHSNGVVFDLPLPPEGGAREVAGTLTFGVGTSANNRLDRAAIIPVSTTGRFTTTFRGRVYPDSYIDSGTETYILDNPELPRCPGMDWAFCAEPGRWLEATVVGEAGTHHRWPFRVGDYSTARARDLGASDGMAVAAEPGSTSFVWGAPFFLGKRVAVVLDGMRVPGSADLQGPLYGIAPVGP